MQPKIQMRSLRFSLTANQLKLIAAASMLIDHVGAAFFPHLIILRVIGRLSFPIFSYFVFIGFHHTRSRSNYLFRILGLGLVCAAGYWIYSGQFYGNVLLTFSASIGVLSVFYLFQANLYRPDSKACIILIIFLIFSIIAVYVLCSVMDLDYGFYGAILPLFAELAGTLSKDYEQSQRLHLIGFGMGLFILSLAQSGVQFFCLLSLPLLFCYNGQKGRYRLKTFFYLFYPLHLMLIGLLPIQM